MRVMLHLMPEAMMVSLSNLGNTGVALVAMRSGPAGAFDCEEECVIVTIARHARLFYDALLLSWPNALTTCGLQYQMGSLG